MRALAGVVLVAPLLLSGCLETAHDAATPAATTPTPPPSSSTSHGPSRPPPSTSATSPGGPGNGTAGDPPPTAQKPWPAIGDATIRPGVQVIAGGAQCTSNFLFRSPDNATLYLGLAAHCVDGLKIGAAAQVVGASHAAKVAYSSWIAKGLTCDATAAGTGCTDGEFMDDFALVAIDPADRGKVHPALLHFGGPTALYDSQKLQVGDRVLGYGNSELWLSVENAHWHEGIVTQAQGATSQFMTLTVPPGIEGDSGSAILTRDGRAAGLLVTGCIAPCTGQNGVVGLAGQISLAKAKAGLDVRLVTWVQLDDGLLP